MTELILQPGSPLIGQSIAETSFRQKYGIEVIEIIRDRTRLLPNVEGGLLKDGDILLVQGNLGTLVGLRDSMKLKIKALRVEDQDLQDERIVLAEAFECCLDPFVLEQPADGLRVILDLYYQISLQAHSAREISPSH